MVSGVPLRLSSSVVRVTDTRLGGPTINDALDGARDEAEEPLDLESTPMGRLLAEARRVVEEGRPGAEPRDLACDLPVVAAGASGRHPRVACAGAQ